MANSAVFNFRRNAGSDWISLAEIGREFQFTQFLRVKIDQRQV